MNFELTSKIGHKTLLILHQKGLGCSLLLRLCQPDITWREQWRSEKRIEDIHQWRCRIIDILKIKSDLQNSKNKDFQDYFRDIDIGDRR